MRIKKLLLVCGSAVALLAACDSNTTSSSQQGTLTEPEVQAVIAAGDSAAEQGIQVGSKAVAANEAGSIFKKICIDRVNPASLGMVQNKVSKTWYDQTRNLSAQRDVQAKGECSFIFGSTESDKAIIRAIMTPLNEARSNGDDITLGFFAPVAEMPGNQTLYRVLIMK